MCDLHFRMKNNGDIIEIAKLEDDIEIVSRIDEPRGIMDDESNTGERTLPGELDQVFIRSEIIMGNSENRCSGMERKALVIPKDDLIVFWKYFIDRIYERSGVGFDHEEFVPEKYIVTRGSESFGIEIAQSNRFIENSFLYIQIREKHRG